MEKWTTVEDIPDQTGKVIIITGANSGIGFESAMALARKNAHVVMAVRSLDRGQTAMESIKRQIPNANLDLRRLNLGSLDSVKQFTDGFLADYDRLDILINNAGVMALPRTETADGFEMQFGTNHLGHFALTGRLIGLLIKTPASRIVTLTSTAQYAGSINFDDLQSKKNYSRYGAYGQSKFANMVFALALAHRLEVAGVETISVAAQPGWSLTNLQPERFLDQAFYTIFNPILGHSPDKAALSQLYGATGPDVTSGDFFGPNFLRMRGYPVREKGNQEAFDRNIQDKLWEVSKELTSVRYEALEHLTENL